MNFFEFLNCSVTPYHTVFCLRTEFEKAGYKPLPSMEKIKLGELYYAERGGAFIAIKLPEKITSKTHFRLALAHTDFPALKISPNPDKMQSGISTLHTEIYGGLIYNSWLDRDLGYAGLLAYEKDNSIYTKLIRGEKLFRIPELAIHLNRDVNKEGLKINPQTDFNVLWSRSNDKKFIEVLKKEIPQDASLLDFDIQLFDAQSANKGGIEDEWIYSGRLDNLSSCHAIAESLISVSNQKLEDIDVACFFNNEEVGSNSYEGASGNFLRSTLKQIWKSSESLDKSLSESLALSIDMAHAEHPNHPEKHEPNHNPILGAGVVLKTNAQKRYASDVMSCARLRKICKAIALPLQDFIMRNDMPCGSTVGPTISASLGIPTVDIGEPMLSMHSIREMMAEKDHQDMTLLITNLFRNDTI